MKTITSINRTGKLVIPPPPEPIDPPTPVVPDDPRVSEIKFSPTASVLDRFSVYLVASTRDRTLELRSADSVLDNPWITSLMLFLTTRDDRTHFERCYRVHFVYRVTGLSRPSTLPDGRIVSTVCCQVVLLPGQSAHLIPNPAPQGIKINVPLVSPDIAEDFIYFRPSYDMLYSTPFTEEHYNVKWWYAGHNDDSPVKCSVTTVSGASLANYTVICGRNRMTKIEVTNQLTTPGTGSLLIGRIQCYYGDDVFSIPVRMFDLVAATNYNYSGSAGDELYWLGFELKKGQAALRPMMMDQSITNLIPITGFEFTMDSHQWLIMTSVFI